VSGAAEVFLVFLRLGLTSFGGPIAHLAYFREAFVVKRQWIDEAAYADLVALCQFLPGPASSQVGFALGLKRAGWLGGVAAWLGFTAPSAALMIGAAYGLQHLTPETLAPLVHGFKLVAVAVVAHAVVGMARTLLDTPLRWGFAIVAAAGLIMTNALFAPFFMFVAGAIGAVRWDRPQEPWMAPPPGKIRAELDRASLVVFALLLLALALAFGPLQLADTRAQLAAAMAGVGALVFGGGHAVLPLMEAQTVARGWLSEDMFLAGYGAAQALPGPLFSFAAFVGAAAGGVAGALVALAAIFAPGLAFVALALPWWERLKSWRPARGFVAGASAAVVGVLAAALWDPVITSGVESAADAAVALAGFALLQWARAPSWLVVALVAAAGAMLAA
jgi:chromate transporter